LDDKVLNSRPTTRAMARRVQEDLDSATDDKDIFVYMFEGIIT